MPDVVKQPSGINLGGTSFYDGFASMKPGFTLINYGRYNHLDAIIDNYGHKSPAFNHPRIDVFNEIFQPAWISPLAVPGGEVGVDAIISVTSLNSSFRTPGIQLTDNNFSFADTYLGAFYQHYPIISDGRPVLAWRTELLVVAPTGGFNSRKDINQGSGFWSLTPYVNATLLPIPKLEITGRLTYIYNFKTEHIADPPPIPNLQYHNGQAGKAAWINFASSYEVSQGIRPGINGFFFNQFTADKTNGKAVDGSLAKQLYVGPGISIGLGEGNVLNFNAYFPVTVRNAASGPILNYQFVHVF